jgi:hypothetical protein
LTFVRVAGRLAIMIVLAGASSAGAVEAVNVHQGAAAIDLTEAVEWHRTDTDRLSVSAAPGADGIVQRMDVRARQGGSTTNWAVFALTTTGTEQLDRLIVVPHYRMVGSGLLWPDLGRPPTYSVSRSTPAA